MYVRYIYAKIIARMFRFLFFDFLKFKFVITSLKPIFSLYILPVLTIDIS